MNIVVLTQHLLILSRQDRATFHTAREANQSATLKDLDGHLIQGSSLYPMTSIGAHHAEQQTCLRGIIMIYSDANPSIPGPIRITLYTLLP